MSPLNRPPIQSKYCEMRGSFAPSRSFSASTARWSASGPRMLRPTSPGSTCAPMNTIRLSRNSVIRLSRMRLPMKRAIYDFTRPVRLRSKWPIAVTSTLAMSVFAPVR